jgi:transposase
MEATGLYYLSLADTLYTAGWSVYVLNPLSTKGFARSELNRIKTDKVDSKLIAQMIEEKHQRLQKYAPKSIDLMKISSMVHFAESLIVQRASMKNRMHAMSLIDSKFSEEVKKTIDTLKLEIERVFAFVDTLLLSIPALKLDIDLIASVPGFGLQTALRLVASVGDIRRFKSAKSFAAYCGITPRFHESGKGRKVPRISRVGPPASRAVLWICARAACRSKSPHGVFYRRLVARGVKPGKALVALAARLARVVWHTLICENERA